MADRLELYWISGSPYAWRVMLALEVKKLPFETHLLVASEREHKSPEYLALNPRGTVPTLKVGDLILYESLAIMAYLEAKYPSPSLFGKTPGEIGATWRAALEADSVFSPVIIDGINRPIFRGKTEEKADSIKEQAGFLHELLAPLEKALQAQDWLVGDNISAGDIALYPFMAGLLRASEKPEAQELDLGFLPLKTNYPGLDQWMKRICALPRYIETVPLHWR